MKKMENMKTVKSLEDSDLLLKGVVKQLKIELKNNKKDFVVCY